MGFLEPKKADKEKEKEKEKKLNTVASPVIKKVDNLEQKNGMRTIEEIMRDYKVQNDGKKHPQNYWQERALHFMEKLEVPAKDRPIVFKYFKTNMTLMESICSYILESTVPIKKPVAYILYEYKRRKQS